MRCATGWRRPTANLPSARRSPGATGRAVRRRADRPPPQDARRRHRRRLRAARRRRRRPHAPQRTHRASERGTRMKFPAAIAALALLAGCAGGGAPGAGDAPSVDTGTIVGEVSDPRNRAKLHTELAGAYYSRGSMGVALEELRTAVATDPGYAPAYGMFGVVYMELRETQLAEQNFERALRLAPNDPDINHNFGLFLCQTKREPDSIKYFLQAIRNPLYPMPQRSYAAACQCSLRTNNLKDAEEFSQRALKLDPDDPPSLIQMGQIRYRQGRIDEARKLVS